MSQLKAFVSASQDDDDHELMQSLEEAFSGDKAFVDLPSSQAAEVPNVSSSENSPEEANESMEEEQDAQEVAKDQSARRASQRLWRMEKAASSHSPPLRKKTRKMTKKTTKKVINQQKNDY